MHQQRTPERAGQRVTGPVQAGLLDMQAEALVLWAAAAGLLSSHIVIANRCTQNSKTEQKRLPAAHAPYVQPTLHVQPTLLQTSV